METSGLLIILILDDYRRPQMYYFCGIKAEMKIQFDT